MARGIRERIKEQAEKWAQKREQKAWQKEEKKFLKGYEGHFKALAKAAQKDINSAKTRGLLSDLDRRSEQAMSKLMASEPGTKQQGSRSNFDNVVAKMEAINDKYLPSKTGDFFTDAPRAGLKEQIVSAARGPINESFIEAQPEQPRGPAAPAADESTVLPPLRGEAAPKPLMDPDFKPPDLGALADEIEAKMTKEVQQSAADSNDHFTDLDATLTELEQEVAEINADEILPDLQSALADLEETVISAGDIQTNQEAKSVEAETSDNLFEAELDGLDQLIAKSEEVKQTALQAFDQFFYNEKVAHSALSEAGGIAADDTSAKGSIELSALRIDALAAADEGTKFRIGIQQLEIAKVKKNIAPIRKKIDKADEMIGKLEKRRDALQNKREKNSESVYSKVKELQDIKDKLGVPAQNASDRVKSDYQKAAGKIDKKIGALRKRQRSFINRNEKQTSNLNEKISILINGSAKARGEITMAESLTIPSMQSEVEHTVVDLVEDLLANRKNNATDSVINFSEEMSLEDILREINPDLDMPDLSNELENPASNLSSDEIDPEFSDVLRGLDQFLEELNSDDNLEDLNGSMAALDELMADLEPIEVLEKKIKDFQGEIKKTDSIIEELEQEKTAVIELMADIGHTEGIEKKIKAIQDEIKQNDEKAESTISKLEQGKAEIEMKSFFDEGGRIQKAIEARLMNKVDKEINGVKNQQEKFSAEKGQEIKELEAEIKGPREVIENIDKQINELKDQQAEFLAEKGPEIKALEGEVKSLRAHFDTPRETIKHKINDTPDSVGPQGTIENKDDNNDEMDFSDVLQPHNTEGASKNLEDLDAALADLDQLEAELLQEESPLQDIEDALGQVEEIASQFDEVLTEEGLSSTAQLLQATGVTSRAERDEAREAVKKEEKGKEKEPVVPGVIKTQEPAPSISNDSQVEHEGPKGPGR